MTLIATTHIPVIFIPIHRPWSTRTWRTCPGSPGSSPIGFQARYSFFNTLTKLPVAC
ncbi:MAG TPA: hypothetical protein VFJ07_05865 [Streptosporangiaceae bacterium]|nr:hypothetical protein [Streptosporangiaceae bacterium]